MLNRLLFSRGDKKPLAILTLNAASWRIKNTQYYGFNPSYGTLTPNTIVYKDATYHIAAIFCRVSSSASFVIAMATSVPFSTIRLRYNNVEYNISKSDDAGVFSKAGALWSNTGTHTLEILAIT